MTRCGEHVEVVRDDPPADPALRSVETMIQAARQPVAPFDCSKKAKAMSVELRTQMEELTHLRCEGSHLPLPVCLPYRRAYAARRRRSFGDAIVDHG